MSPTRRTGERWARAAVLLAGLIALAVPVHADVALPEPGAADDAAHQPPAYTGPWEHFGTSSPRSSLTSTTTSLAITRADGDVVTLAHTSDFDPAPASMRLTFDLAIDGVKGRVKLAQVLRVGAGFGETNADESNARTYARLGVATTGGGFQLVDLATGRTGPTFTGTQAVTWALNRTGAAVKYVAPDGSTESLASDRMDVWAGRDKVFDDAAVTSPAAGMTDLKWTWSAGAGTTTFANVAAWTLDGATPLTSIDAHSIPAATSAADAAPAQATLELYRPSPNPFERTTQFAYAVPGTASHVDIGVFDVAGRRVRSLVQGLQGAGTYQVSWNGVADDGVRARDGVYFLRAAIGGTSRVVRVVYLVKQ